MVAATGGKNGRPKNNDALVMEDRSSDGIPDYPVGLKAPGKKDWDRIWTVGKWLNREQHFLLVRQYCQKIDQIFIWEKELKILSAAEGGLSTYKQANGAYAPFPQVRLIDEGQVKLISWLQLLRLTPETMPDMGEADDLLDELVQNRDADALL